MRHGVLLRNFPAMVADHHGIDGVARPYEHRRCGEQVYPQSAPREERLSHLQANHGPDLRPPLAQVRLRDHLVDSSPPMRYSYTELTLSSAGATLSISIPFIAI